jgi:hypothetical protein
MDADVARTPSAARPPKEMASRIELNTSRLSGSNIAPCTSPAKAATFVPDRAMRPMRPAGALPGIPEPSNAALLSAEPQQLLRHCIVQAGRRPGDLALARQFLARLQKQLTRRHAGAPG